MVFDETDIPKSYNTVLVLPLDKTNKRYLTLAAEIFPF